jgi:hypothetical protein
VLNHYNHHNTSNYCQNCKNILNFKGFLKILSSLQCKTLCYLLHIVGDVYHPGFAIIFYIFFVLFTSNIISF